MKPKTNLIQLCLVSKDNFYSFELKLRHHNTLKRIEEKQQKLYERMKYKGAV